MKERKSEEKGKTTFASLFRCFASLLCYQQTFLFIRWKTFIWATCRFCRGREWIFKWKLIFLNKLWKTVIHRKFRINSDRFCVKFIGKFIESNRKKKVKGVKTEIFRSGIFSDLNLIFWIFLWNKAIEMTPTLLVSTFATILLGQAAFVQVKLKFYWIPYRLKNPLGKSFVLFSLPRYVLFPFFSVAILNPMTHFCEREKGTETAKQGHERTAHKNR